jgi:hypothetical protein
MFESKKERGLQQRQLSESTPMLKKGKVNSTLHIPERLTSLRDSTKIFGGNSKKEPIGFLFFLGQKRFLKKMFSRNLSKTKQSFKVIWLREILKRFE